MAEGEKPYRVYRGGRTKGRVPLPVKPTTTPPRQATPDGRGGFRYPGPGTGKPPRKRRRWSWKRRIAVGFAALFLFVVAWAVASYFSFRDGVSAANKRFPAGVKPVLDRQNGLLLSHPSDVLLLGTDHSQLAARAGDRHSDSILLVRTDPGRHRIVFLSIPRDLRVSIPGHGEDKINAAFQIGGPALAARTVRAYTGLPVNHVVIVDFGDFESLIDKIGGVDVNVPRPILSNRFDCPFSTQARCQRWPGWRFRKGNQHMNGHRALIYTRIRENRLDPSESDITRGQRQQEVLQAIAGKLTGFGTLYKLPFIGGDLLKPLSTDLSTGQFLSLGWVKFRAGSTLHCRLGGTPLGGYLLGEGDQNRRVIFMVTGRSAPQPPPPGEPFAAGCT